MADAGFEEAPPPFNNTTFENDNSTGFGNETAAGPVRVCVPTCVHTFSCHTVCQCVREGVHAGECVCVRVRVHWGSIMSKGEVAN